MEVIYLLIPVAIILTIIIVGVFIWAIRHGQFDDLEGPAHRILIDDDQPDSNSKKMENNKSQMKSSDTSE